MSHAKQLHNRRYLNDYLEIINREGLPGNVKNDLCLQVQDVVITTVQQVIEAALDEELHVYLGLERYEHLPWGRPAELTRSGSYRRELITQYGPIDDLRVPKLRRGNGDLNWHSLTRYERCWGPLLDQQVMGYCLGLSLRDLQEMMALTLGDVLSLSACNRIVSSVTARVEAFKSQPLESPPPVVMVDGMWVKIAYPTGEIKADVLGRRRYAKRKQKRVVLSALGVWPDGHWEIVHWQIAEGETADSWQTFVQQLQSKGMTRDTTRLVVSDGATGLESALDHYLWGVPHQRCLFHKIKNLADHLVFNDLQLASAETPEQAVRAAKRARKKAVLAEASWVYEGQSAAEIEARARLFAMIWRDREPEAVAHFGLNFHKTLAYLSIEIEPSLHPLIRTTNLLERFHKEARRKQRDIGMFQSEQGCEVIWYLLSIRESAKQRAALKNRP
jgi:transposase-like protein